MKLTDAQRRAVETEARDVLVVAGAGSGKTAVMVARVAHLLEHGASPSELLVLTFTRKAAGELIERLEDVDTTGMLIGTFHSVALKILLEHGEKLGYNTASLTVLEPDDADLVLEHVCRDLGYSKGKNVWKKGLSWKRVKQHREYVYSMVVDDEFDFSVIEQPEWLKDCDTWSRCHRIHAEYCNRLFSLNALDFGQILVQCNKLFEDHLSVLDLYHERIKHVLLDESQDQDRGQYTLHNRFAPPATMFAVGDPRQTIYRWRGADDGLMYERDPKVISLRECFRCGDNIVEAANRLIAHNHEDECEPMIGRTGEDGSVVSDFSGRSKAVIDVALGYTHDYSPRDIAILGRNHRTLRRLEKMAREHGVDVYRVGSRFDVCETDEFKLLHAALRLCVNPRDNLAFMRLSLGMGTDEREFARVQVSAAMSGRSYWDAYSRNKDPEYPKIHDLAHQIADASDDRIDQVIERFRGDPPSLWQTLDSEKFWLDSCGHLPIADALRWFAMRDSQDDITDKDVITLMTVHAAKGLEWPVVIVAGLNEGDFPSSMALREDEGVRDERRLCYVAMTRAKKVLVLHHRKPHDQDATRKIKAPSRFLGETKQGVLT